MATLVVDIETISQPREGFSQRIKEDLLRLEALGETKREMDVKESVHKNAITSSASLSPLTGQIFSLGIYDIERKLGTVYSSEEIIEKEVLGLIVKKRTEREMLEDFWEGAMSYDIFVTYNGWPFVLAFLYHRSAVLGIKPKLEIAKQRFLTKQSFPYHVDLLHELSFSGAMKRNSLLLWCEAYGVEYQSKINGRDVAEFFQQKKFCDICLHNAADVLALSDLYGIWLKYHAPASFLNVLEW